MNALVDAQFRKIRFISAKSINHSVYLVIVGGTIFIFNLKLPWIFVFGLSYNIIHHKNIFNFTKCK